MNEYKNWFESKIDETDESLGYSLDIKRYGSAFWYSVKNDVYKECLLELEKKGNGMMERLTERDEHCADPKDIYVVYVKDHDYILATNRLADYEDSGLMPEQVIGLKNTIRLILEEIEKESVMYLNDDDYEGGIIRGLELACDIIQEYIEKIGVNVNNG